MPIPSHTGSDVRAAIDAAGNSWDHGPAELALVPGTVHLWKADLRRCSDLSDAAYTLAVNERARAERFLVQEARDRYIAARLTLRRILSRYTGDAASALQFEYGPQGKPALQADRRTLMPAFNTSHSGHLALYAVTLGSPVGVDIEAMRPVPNAGSIVASYFAPGEREVYSQIPASRRLDTFHRWWVMKEAYIKGIGRGQIHPLDTFDVLSGEGMEVDWQVVPVAVDDGYVAALATVGHEPLLRCRLWEE